MSSTLNDYVTRGTSIPGIIPRADPVVWGPRGATEGSIDADNLDAYETNGFLTVDSLLSPEEVEFFQAEIRDLAASKTLERDERFILERDSGDLRSIFEVHKVSEAFGRLARDSRLLDRARQILGSEVYIHQSRINYKPGFESSPFYWHSDFETWHAEDGMPRMRALSVSLSLTENFEFNGSLMIIPRSHQSFVVCTGVTPMDHYKESLKGRDVGIPDRALLTELAHKNGIEQITGPAGSATFFDCNCLHGSNGNITPFPRSNVFLVYNSVENSCVEPFAAPGPRPTFLGARDYTPLQGLPND